MEEQRQLMELIKQVYPQWCQATGNTGCVKLSELESAAAMMGDLHKNGKLLMPEEQARQTLWQLLEDLNEKSLYIQSRSFLPAAAKGLPNWAKWLILLVGVAALAALALFAEDITAATRAAQGITEAASYSIA